MRKLIVMAACALLALCLSGCVSEEAKAVIEEINQLGEVNLASIDQVDAVNELYAALSDKDKEDVSNYAVLEEANETISNLMFENVKSTIAERCSDPASVTASDYSKLKHAMEFYPLLSDEQKSQIENYELLEESWAICVPLQAEYAYEEVIAYSSAMKSLAEATFNEYRDIMTEEQIATCLYALNRDDALSKCDSYIKGLLKNPNSYSRYDESLGVPTLQEEDEYRAGEYKARITISYRATNSFNATISDKIACYVYFTVDTDNMSINFTEARATEYYAWQLAS